MQKILSEDLTDNVLMNAPVGILTVDNNLTVTFANETLLQFNLSDNSSVDELINLKLDEISYFKNSKVQSNIAELKEGVPFELEVSNRKTLDGNEITVILKASPIIENNSFSGAIFIFEDFKVPISISPDKIIENNIFDSFVKSISDYFIITDITGVVQYTPQKETLKKHNNLFNKRYKQISEIFGGKYKSEIDELFSEAVNSKEVVYSQNLNDNEYPNISFQLTFIPIPEKSGKINLIFILFEDVTETINKIKNLENEASELRTYQAISSTVLDAIIALNLKGEITFWNEAATRVFGASRSETFGKFIGNIVEEFTREYFDKIVKSLQISKSWETKINTKLHGFEKVISMKLAITDDEENPSIVALCSDITNRENLERALRTSEETFRNIVTNTSEYICTFTLNGKITYANPFLINGLGYSDVDFQEMELADLIDIDNIDEKDFNLNNVIEKELEAVELTLLSAKKERVFVLANFTAVRDLQEAPKYYIASFTDISEKRTNDQELTLIRSVFESATEGITLQRDDKFVHLNQAFVEIFEYSSIDEALGINPLEIYLEKEKVKEEYSNLAIDESLKSVYECRKKNGDKILVEKDAKKFSTKEGVFISESFTDVTKQKEAELALKQSEEKYRSITENIDDAIWTLEIDEGKNGKVFISPAITKITDYEIDEFLENKKLWIKIIHPDDKINVISKIRRVYKDPVRDQLEIEYRIIGKYGSLLWVRNKFKFLRDEFGAIEKIFGLLSDITSNKKNAEKLEQTTKQLKSLNDSKDRFISIISHDLRTPFSSILGFTDLLLMDRDIEEEKQVQYIGFIQESAKNMLTLVNSLLDWTRLQTGRIEYIAERIDANTIIDNAIQMMTGSAIQKEIKLYSTIEQETYVHGDRNLLLQVFNNLISNAIKFTKSGGEIFISAEPIVDKKVIQFSVNDTGVGISDKDVGKLFSVDSKFTSDGTQGEKGSGLGLSLVREIINKHGGEIYVESEVGEGSSFIFTIPISSTKILIIDDSSSDAILYKKLLNNIIPNYDVDIARNGVEGFEIIEQSLPALIISDHNMPQMSGFEFVKKVSDSDIKYKPPIIILSSDITNDIRKEYEELGIEYVFKKPVDIDLFKNAIEKSLQKALIT